MKLALAGLALVLGAALAEAREFWILAGTTVARVEPAWVATDRDGGLPPIRALAPVSGARAWALADDRLLLIDRSLAILVEVPLATLSAEGARVVAGDPVTGGIWLADGTEVIGFDVDGSQLFRWQTPDRIASLVYSGPEAIYVASETHVARFDAHGAPRSRVDVSTIAAPGAPRLLLDPLSGLLWVIRDDIVIQLDAIAGLSLRHVVTGMGAIVAASLDPHSGELTLRTSEGTSRFDRDAKTSADLVHSLIQVEAPHFGLRPPLALVPTVEVASRDDTPPAGVRITLRFGAQCDGFACPNSADYVGTLRLNAMLGNRSVADRFAIGPAGDNATGALEREPDFDTSLRVELTDFYGQRSQAVLVELDEAGSSEARVRPKANVPPSVAITAPANNAIFVAPTTIVVNANATDSDGTVVKVEFFRSGTLASTDTAPPWSATLSNLAAGTYTLTAKATDNTGAATTSAPITVQVKANVAPSVSLTSPAANATFTAPATITLSATATDSDGTISKVEFFRGGTTKIATDTAAPYTYSWTNVAAGNYALTAVATDDKSAATTTSTVNISVNAPPTVALSSPAAGAVYVAPASIVLTATAGDGDGTIAKVEFFEGATKLFTDTAAPYTYTRTNAGPGTYSYTAAATDNKGAATASAARSVTVIANQAPTVTITAPVANAMFTSGTAIAIAATATDSDGTISRVEFYRNGVLLGADTSPPYAYNWTNAAAGNFALTAKATDDKGGVSTSAAVNIVVNAGPSVAILTPVHGAMIPGPANILVSVNAIDSDGTVAKVELFRNGVLIGTKATFPYDFTWNGAAAGVYVLTAKATDNRGAVTASAAVSVTIVANDPPHVEFSYPFDGGGYGGPVASIPMSIAAWDTDGMVVKVDVYVGTTLLYTFPEPPYDFAWPDVVTGTYAIIAVATDDSGATTSSAPVVIKVVAPVISVVAPVDNATYVAPAAIPLAVSAYEDGADIIQVQYFANGTPVEYSSAPPWSALWANAPVGSYLVTARAYDTWGTVVTSAPVRMTVGANQLPVVTLEAPETGAAFTITGSTPIRFRATANDADGSIERVQFILGSGPAPNVLGSVSTPPYEFTWTPALSDAAPGVTTVYAEAIDEKGGSRRSPGNQIYIVRDQAPAVTLLTPGPNRSYAQTQSGTVVVVGRASAFFPLSGVSPTNALRQLELLDGATVVGTLAAPNTDNDDFAFMLRSLPTGNHVLTLKATDTAGMTATSYPTTVSVEATNRRPTIALSAPTSGQRFVQPAAIGLTSSVADVDGTVAKVEYLADNMLVATSTVAPFSATWLGAPAGTHSIVGRVTDNRGAMSVSAPAQIEVALATVPPLVALTSPSVCGSISNTSPIAIAADALSPVGTIARVEFYSGATLIGSATTAPYAIAWSNAPIGIATVTARAIDGQGRITTSAPMTIGVTGTNQPPTVAVTAPTDGQSFTAPASIALAANATDVGGSIAKIEFFTGGASLGAATAAPWTRTWANVGAGTYAIVAKATDNLSATRTSAPVTVTVNSVAASVTVSVPLAGAKFLQGQPIAIAAQASSPGQKIARIEFLADSVVLWAASFVPPASPASASFAWSAATPGPHTITARAVDSAGGVVTSTPVAVSVSDLQVELIAPRANESYLAPADVRMVATPTVSGDTVAQVEFLADGVAIATLTAEPFVFVWTGVPAGPHEVGARARTVSGLVATALAANVVVAAKPSIQAGNGIDGSNVTDDNVSITGSVIGQANAAVVVNGRRAALAADGTFFLDGVQLSPGANILTLVLNSMDGAPVTRTLSVTRAGTQSFGVLLDPVDGLAPLSASLTITRRDMSPFQRIEIDTNDDGKPETTFTSLVANEARVDLTFTSPGIHTVRVTVFDADGKVIYVARRRVRAIGPEELGTVILGVYESMVNRLAAGDTAGALRTFTGDAQARYQEIFTALGPDLRTIARQLGSFVDGVVTEQWAEITMVRDTPDGKQAFMIYLIRGGDGIWRMESM